MNTFLVIIVGLGLTGLAGCATTVWYGTPTNLKSTTLSIGMSQQQAQALYGSPAQISSQQIGNMLVETWKYLDKTLTFHNGRLSSWSAAPAQPPADQLSPEGFPPAL